MKVWHLLFVAFCIGIACGFEICSISNQEALAVAKSNVEGWKTVAERWQTAAQEWEKVEGACKATLNDAIATLRKVANE